MSLTQPEPPARQERPPWRGLVAGLLAAVLFVIGLALTAYATRDRAGPVRPPAADAGRGAAIDPIVEPADAQPHDPQPYDPQPYDAQPHDAQPHDAQPDAGMPGEPDASAVATAAPEPDAGPIGPVGPPVELSQVTAAVGPVLQQCLRESLRFDPSLGGRVTLRVELRGRRLSVLPPAGSSPVFSGCLAQRPARLDGAATSANVTLRVLLDGLRGTAVVEDAQFVE